MEPLPDRATDHRTRKALAWQLETWKADLERISHQCTQCFHADQIEEFPFFAYVGKYEEEPQRAKVAAMNHIKCLVSDCMMTYHLQGMQLYSDIRVMNTVARISAQATGEDSSIQGDKDSQDSPSSASPPPAIDSLPMPASPEDIDAMSTQSLMQFASSFVARMRVQSVPWLTERMLTIYGECPDDAAIFPWWFASMLPVKDLGKYRLLGTSSVRERLKICCSWIIEWQTSRW